MMIDADVLSEVWLALKEYIPAKERQAAADHMVTSVTEYEIADNDLRSLGGTDRYLKNAVGDLLEDDSDDDIDEVDLH